MDVATRREGVEEGGGGGTWRVTKSHTAHQRQVEKHQQQLGKVAQLLHLLVPALQLALPAALAGSSGGEAQRTRPRRGSS